MIQPQQHGSQVKVFFVIYLVITAVVGSAIFFLMRSQREIDQKLKEDKSIALVPGEEIAGKPPAPKPAPEDAKSKPKSKPKARPPVKQESREPTPEPEPSPESEKKKTLTADELRQIEELYPFPEIQPLMEIVNNWQEVPPNAFPKMVSIRKAVDFDVKNGGKTIARGKLPIGSMMTPVRLQSDQLTLTTGGASPITTTISVEDTDFKDRIQERYHSFVEQRKAQVVAQRNAERDRRLGAIAREESLSEWNEGTDPRFDPVKASLRRGDASVYTLDNASMWRWGGSESIDGTEYETVFVLIVTEAAFGVSERELKVLMREGEVVLWLDPETGEAI